jgi:antitoxin ParD1/3/4
MTIQHVQISEHTQELVDALVKSGAASSPEALVESAVEQYAAKLDTLRAAVKEGFDDLDEGRYTDIQDDAELDAHVAKLRAERVAERAAAR